MHAIELCDLMARLEAWYLPLEQWCTKQDKNVFLYATCFCLLVCNKCILVGRKRVCSQQRFAELIH